jgi:PAS domain S-box-containing protein
MEQTHQAEIHQIAERRFSQFFETLPEFCYMVSPDGMILGINRAASDGLGYSEEELVGKPLATIYAPESHAKMRELLEKWKTTGKLCNEEMVVVTKHGGRRTVLLNVGSVVDAAGKLLHSTSVQLDITERKRMEQTLRESETRARAIITSAMDAIITIDDEQHIVMFNPAAERMFGWQEQDVIGSHIERLIPKRFRNSHRAKVIQFGEKGNTTRSMGALGSLWGLRKDGEEFPIEASISKGEVEGKQQFTAIIRDIAENKRIQETLELATQQTAVTRCSRDFRYLWANQLYADLLQRPLDEIVGRPILEVLGKEAFESLRHHFERALAGEKVVYEEEVDYQSVGRRWISASYVPTLNASGVVDGWVAVIVDVTERKLAEEAISKVSQILIQAQEQERSRLARELHDDISQRVALLALTLQDVSRGLPLSAELCRQIGEVYKQLVELGNDIRALSHSFHSPRLELLGLTKTAATFCTELSERYGVKIDFHADNIPQKLPEEISLCLFRILQEALENARKHSGMGYFQVWLRCHASEIELVVRDLGRGFEPKEAINGDGLGLSSMKERLKLVNGQLSIQSEPGRGTAISARVPFGSTSK